MSKIKHDETRRRRDVKLNKAKTLAQGQVEQYTMQGRENEIKVLVFGLFSKPKRTNDFWVILPRELDLEEIRERINNCFGDLID